MLRVATGMVLVSSTHSFVHLDRIDRVDDFLFHHVFICMFLFVAVRRHQPQLPRIALFVQLVNIVRLQPLHRQETGEIFFCFLVSLLCELFLRAMRCHTAVTHT